MGMAACFSCTCGWAISGLWKTGYKYGKNSLGGKMITTKAVVQRLQASGSKDKGVLMMKRMVCSGYELGAAKGKKKPKCSSFKMGQCFRCTDKSKMHQVETRVNWRGTWYVVPPKRIMFAEHIKDGDIYRPLTAGEKLLERKRFAQCAMDLLMAYPKSSALPAANQCSLHCHYTCNQKWMMTINKNCVSCSSLTPKGETSAERYTTSGLYDMELFAGQLGAF